MKIKTALILAAVSIASYCVADLATVPKPPANLAVLQTQLTLTQARADTLENRVRSLEQTVSRLDREVAEMQHAKVIPVLVK